MNYLDIFNIYSSFKKTVRLFARWCLVEKPYFLNVITSNLKMSSKKILQYKVKY